ncbi:hypothetical protein Clacol_002354 [Clathrus columnatus]|uniref:Autophagy-related protein 17 n=1 Tax=Clathrus columnatus TaxID=1419009 RepID=A0AAV5A0G4_9AGAM|nr:hypothetical protein Clacol_002354 [Clathrus columnatus]
MAATVSQNSTPDRSSSPPHLVSLVLQSKKALQQGEQLLLRAHDLTITSSNHVVDVLALDAKIRWITQGIMEQIKAAAGVARSITERRQKLEEEAADWDNMRSQHQDSLDATLEALGVQVVPPSFHQSTLEFTLFGIQASDRIFQEDEIDDRENELEDRYKARKKWKTLRDFVDERGLEDVIESIEGERNALDATLSATALYPGTILSITEQIHHALNASLHPENSIPLTRPSSRNMPSPSQEKALPVVEPPSLKDTSAILLRQEKMSIGMATHLESLAAHYEQMATALKDKDSGGSLNEEDMDVFIRDTAELPAILHELEESISAIESAREEILTIKTTLKDTLKALSLVMDSLDELADKMEIMLQEQSDIEFSYNALILEIERRRQHRDKIEATVRQMKEQLDKIRDAPALTLDEISARNEFYAEHSSSIPDDLCLAISNLPQSYSITSFCKNSTDENQTEREILPEIDEDIIEDARRRLEAESQRIPEMMDTPTKPVMRREDSL